MKKYISGFFIFLLVISSYPLTVLADNVASQTLGEIDLSKEDDHYISKLINEINPSVVAIIGENKSYRESQELYTKIPSNLQHGSGVIINSNGRIITNNHVIEGMEEIYVVMYDGKVYRSHLLYRDEKIDLALIKIKRDNLKPIQLENPGKIAVGNKVVAIGTPLSFGYLNSASLGIISGLNRPVDKSYTYLQTDASINPGNSGGPLVNMDGKLVGINSLSYPSYSGMNFAIPSEDISYFLDHYDSFGRIRRSYTGIQLEENWAAMLGIPSKQGLRVLALKDDAIVSKEEVREGYMLEAINGLKTNSIAAYNEILKKYLPGDWVTLTFSQDGQNFNINVKLLEMEEIK